MDKITAQKYIVLLQEIIDSLKEIASPQEVTPIVAPLAKKEIGPDFNYLESNRQRLKEVTELRMLLNSSIWPVAVDKDSLCPEDLESKIDRAKMILDSFVKEDIKDKRVLDFGYGEGHLAYVVSETAKFVVGYDLELTNKDFSRENLYFTANWNDVLINQPYDLVIVYDVLDHADDPTEVLLKLKKLNAKILMRCHPWTSRHGTHLYKTLNKAYAHLVFSEKEIKNFGLKEIKTNKFIHPLKKYRELIEGAGLNILNEDASLIHEVEPFFTNRYDPKISANRENVAKRIKDHWKESPNPDLASGDKFPFEDMQLQFVDYILTP
jgi:2-polyprenyl-3-methyl-5-hydroxy-6-metoxy-1,4-benzoquinol methylase